jgi:hypothetical protein
MNPIDRARIVATAFCIAAVAAVALPIESVDGAQSPAATGTAPELALQISDFAALPMTGSPEGAGNNAGSLARINVLREEPGPAHRLFVNDLTGPLYILDRTTKKTTTYLDLNGSGSRRGVFDKIMTDPGLASGFISFEFDPDYARTGRFYTIHLEDPKLPGSLLPDNASFPGLRVKGYSPTEPIKTPGPVEYESVLIEWTDTSIANTTFEGTAREVFRVQLNTRIHPIADLTFNPAARRGDADWRVLYIACGDSGSGDQKTSVRLNPQRLDAAVGKILRIIPDLGEQTKNSAVSENGRYRVPADNPFASTAAARPEIWAYGLRNPHRVSWYVDPADPRNARLIATVIGFHTWESAAIVHKGANYGYPFREGAEMMQVDGTMSKPPEADTIPIQLTEDKTVGTVAPTYPVLEYGHGPRGGDAIAGGFGYQGSAIPDLRGKYVLGDTSTGRMWYADIKAMLAADDGIASTLAELHELRIAWNDPSDTPDTGTRLYSGMARVVEAGYHARGGKDPDLPGAATVAGSGRVDLRFGVDRSGELYVLSKSDGMIRLVTGIKPVETSAPGASR